MKSRVIAPAFQALAVCFGFVKQSLLMDSYFGVSPQAVDIEAAVAVLKARGVVFEEYDLPGLKTVNGIAEIAGDGYLSDSGTHYILWFQKGGIAEHLTRDL
jgi:hypothetical protein